MSMVRRCVVLPFELRAKKASLILSNRGVFSGSGNESSYVGKYRMCDDGGSTYTMSRVRVHFPYKKAYPSQVAMMNSIIRALQGGKNALLESPTGSGKSLALLCSALAWQQHEKQAVMEYNEAIDQGLYEPETVYVDENDQEVAIDPDVLRQVQAHIENESLGGGFLPVDGTNDDNEMEDFKDDSKPSKKSSKKPAPSHGEPESLINNLPNEIPLNLPNVISVDRGQGHEPVQVRRKVKYKRVPKIFFGTRTHKQITQIIRELNKTAYRDAKMTILGSREHTCVHPTVSKSKNKNEDCKALNDRKSGGAGCRFNMNLKQRLQNYHSFNKMMNNSRKTAKNSAWDLEDIHYVGKRNGFCPFFGTRELKTKADIIFCPYNYLVEPVIRKSMEISLKDQIVILDEAHNIEDSARSAASWDVTEEDILDAMKDLQRLQQSQVLPEEHGELAKLCAQLAKWIDDNRNNMNDYAGFNTGAKVWNGVEILALYGSYGIGTSARISELGQCLKEVSSKWQELRDAERETEDHVEDSRELDILATQPPASSTMAVLEGFFMVIEYLFRDGMKHRDDYRVALTRTQSKKMDDGSAKIKVGAKAGKDKSAYYSKAALSSAASKVHYTHQITISAHFWCLNPAVAFTDIKEDVRSIVLTSGTLSPMASFSSELDVNFPLKLEANHVIDRRQVWIGTLSHGPTGQNLNATYKNTESFAFQDELGRLTLQVCNTIANGVLLFLPSYALLNKLSDRWRQTGLWAQLGERKVVITEPRFSDEFEASIKQFNEVIEATEKGHMSEGIDGALFMAVCRGKVSEGIDFADNSARAVICVGIPFPSVKDIQVDLKKKYNDARRKENKELKVLSGNEWYEIQAFRALNQALGRCIRHQNDWGAILMVDDRYAKIQRYLGSLSKWVRSSVVHHNRCDQMLNGLADFHQAMRQMDQERFKQEALNSKESSQSGLKEILEIKNKAKTTVKEQPKELFPIFQGLSSLGDQKSKAACGVKSEQPEIITLSDEDKPSKPREDKKGGPAFMSQSPKKERKQAEVKSNVSDITNKENLLQANASVDQKEPEVITVKEDKNRASSRPECLRNEASQGNDAALDSDSKDIFSEDEEVTAPKLPDPKITSIRESSSEGESFTEEDVEENSSKRLTSKSGPNFNFRPSQDRSLSQKNSVSSSSTEKSKENQRKRLKRAHGTRKPAAKKLKKVSVMDGTNSEDDFV